MHIDMNMLVVFLGKCIPPPQKPWLWTEWAAEPTTKMKSSKANFVTWTFRLPPKKQLSIVLNIFFPFIDISYFFPSSKLQHCRAIVLLHWSPKRPRNFSPRKDDILLPLGLPSSSTRVWAYADVRTKFSRIDRLSDLLSNGASLARYAAASAMKRNLSFCFQENHLNGIIWWKQLSNHSDALVQNNKI